MMKAEESDKLFVDRKWTAAIADEGFAGAVIEGEANMASSSRDYVFAVAERTSFGSHANTWKRLVVRMIITFVREPV